MSIGGNTKAIFQIKVKGDKNRIGEAVPGWADCLEITGWLDLAAGEAGHGTFNTKIQESTHYFLCDYQPLIGRVNGKGQEKEVAITSENARMIICGMVYEILLIDNPMNMNQHYEIYLKFIGGQT